MTLMPSTAPATSVQSAPLPAPKSPGRRVVCAALRTAAMPNLILGPRHFDETMRRQIREGIDEGAWVNRTWMGAEQGFIDQRGVFLTRTEAWKVAYAALQIIRRVGGDTADGGTLYSENLY